jgi:two-component system, OmpR family, phosphate regulon response regulator OmpR
VGQQLSHITEELRRAYSWSPEGIVAGSLSPPWRGEGITPVMADEPHLLVVDDDQRIRDLLGRYLARDGFRVTLAGNAGEARAKLGAMEFDLIVLDVMMPGENGFDLTSALRKTSRVPILLLTAMAEPDERIRGLERGADDYLAKPFEPRELVLRIRNILQRVPAAAAASASAAPERHVRFAAFRFDRERSELFRGEEPVHLTAAEASLLASLVKSAGIAVSREALAEEAQFSGNVRTVDVQMTRLRRKIEKDAKFPRYLQTVRGTGYVFKPD